MDTTKHTDENLHQYIWRLGSLKMSGLLSVTWEELANIINDEVGCHRTGEGLRKELSVANKYKTEVFDNSSDSTLKAELLKKQAQTKNVETNKLLREYSRDQLIAEEVGKAITTLPPLEQPPVIHPVEHSDRAGVLCFGDEHFGCQFSIKGLHGEVLNEYNADVFYRRMDLLLSKTVAIVERYGFKDLYVFSFGDFVDGIIHLSQLMALQYGLLEAVVLYSRYICDWLNELSQYVRIHYQMTDGNHTELRLLNMPKGTTKENLGIIVREFIRVRMKDNSNFEMVENPTGNIYETILGYNVLGIHGEFNGSAVNAVKNFANTYNTKINYLLAGHKHHVDVQEVGPETEFIGIPSIIGINDYSVSINAVSNPAATFLVFERGHGKTVQYTIDLK